VRIITRESNEIKTLAEELEFACWSSIGFLYAGKVHSIYDDVINKNVEIQLCLLDERDQVVGALTSTPIAEYISDSGGWDWALQNSVDVKKANMLCGLSMSIAPKYRGKGYAKLLVNALKEKALEYNIKRLVFPVRPTSKSKYLDKNIVEYISLGIDPWINSHLNMGGIMSYISMKSVVIDKPIGFWEAWGGHYVGEHFVVPGALAPIQIIDNRGIYEEPNVWFVHRC
jgi:GNAT superfamily N-acetyltransferase